MELSPLAILVIVLTGVACVDRQKLRVIPDPAPNFDLESYARGIWYNQARYVPCTFLGSIDFTNIRFENVLEYDLERIKQIASWRDGVCSYGNFTLTPDTSWDGHFILQDPIGGMISGDQIIIVYKPMTGYEISWGCTRRSPDRKSCSDPWVAVKTRDRYPGLHIWYDVIRDLKNLYSLTLEEMSIVTQDNPC